MADDRNAPFAGATALIYGGANGIGRAVAREFARRGARVAVADLDKTGADETVSLIVGEGGTAAALRCDVTSELSVREAAVGAEIALGAADIVVNNVGAIINGNPEDMPLAEWERVLSLNLLSAVRSNAVFLPKLIARGRGHIVNVGSFAGLYPYAASRVPYVAAKAAVIAMSESLALYLEPQGIRVSCLCPGPIATGVMAAMKTWTANVPMRGPGSHLVVKTTEDIAVTLADGMRDGRIFIPSHDEVNDTLRARAADPDGFLRAQMAAFAAGDVGRPRMPEGGL